MSRRAPVLKREEINALEIAAGTGHAHGRTPAHGGYAKSRAVLLRHGYISPFNERITDDGRAALAAAKGAST